MKQYFLITFLFAGIAIKAQSPVFMVDCGNDTFFCAGLNTDTFHIGSQIKLTNGVPPFKYVWSCRPYMSYPSSKYTYTASDFLNDTTIANPYIKAMFVKNKPWRFYLTVTDSNNNIATDSIAIQSSAFVYFLGEYNLYLHNGDSVQFFEDFVVIDGGIPPVKYYWTPTAGLDDSAKINAWCKPQESTFYYQYIIDSVGCNSGVNRAYIITILPTSVKNITGKPMDLLNFHQNGERLVFDNPFNKLVKLSFYSIDGKMIYTGETNNSFFDISQLMDKRNITICLLCIDGISTVLKVYF